MLKAKEIINMIASAFYEIEVTGDHVQQILMNENIKDYLKNDLNLKLHNGKIWGVNIVIDTNENEDNITIAGRNKTISLNAHKRRKNNCIILKDREFIPFTVHYAVTIPRRFINADVCFCDNEERADLMKRALDWYLDYCDENNINYITGNKNE